MRTLTIALLLSFSMNAFAQPGMAPDAPREPPPQAYADCRGKQEGETVQHATPEGQVPATCRQSPKGLVARPVRPKASPSEGAAARLGGGGR
jgi:hypothetical protein